MTEARWAGFMVGYQLVMLSSSYLSQADKLWKTCLSQVTYFEDVGLATMYLCGLSCEVS